uniref:Uncharacterized protein n=1 Tax=Arundo donax TaxID=35708 RepID=A0A0A8ZBE2_ARUDO
MRPRAYTATMSAPT